MTKCDVRGCDTPATYEVVKNIPLGEVTFRLCDYHTDITGPFVRTRPLEDAQ